MNPNEQQIEAEIREKVARARTQGVQYSEDAIRVAIAAKLGVTFAPAPEPELVLTAIERLCQRRVNALATSSTHSAAASRGARDTDNKRG